MKNIKALFKISYGLYIISSGDKDHGNGYIANTLFQVSSEPAKFAISCSKDNHTIEFIKRYGVFSASILEQNASSKTISRFGFKSGKDVDKMEGVKLKYALTGAPIVLEDSLAYFECKVVETLDLGSHILFIGELVSSDVIDENLEPLTYEYYRKVKKGVAPKNAPTYVDKSSLEKKQETVPSLKFECPTCGYIYDEAEEDIAFKDLPDDWVCPICGEGKDEFIKI